jgi:hypothetical protein
VSLTYIVPGVVAHANIKTNSYLKDRFIVCIYGNLKYNVTYVLDECIRMINHVRVYL